MPAVQRPPLPCRAAGRATGLARPPDPRKGEISQSPSPRFVEAQLSEAEFIVGNPPFLGGERLRDGLGDDAVETLFSVYAGRVPREADLVTYWFEQARAAIASGATRAAGLVSTNSIRGGANRGVLERLMADATIFDVWSDEPWIVDGAAVRVSLVCFRASSALAREVSAEPTEGGGATRPTGPALRIPNHPHP